MKKTLVVGASMHPGRYANVAFRKLIDKGYDVIGLGKQEGSVEGRMIYTELPNDLKIHTVTLYLRPERQAEVIDLIISLRPERVIFNPGTYHPDFEKLLTKERIYFEHACTLVLLSTGQY